MTFGLITSFIVTFTLLPSLLNLMASEKIDVQEKSFTNFTGFLANCSITKKINLCYFYFINYFKHFWNFEIKSRKQFY